MSKFSTDSNQKKIVAELKQFGYSVEDLARHGRNCPDLLVANNSKNIVVEIKTPTGKFKVGQLEWLANWKGLCGYASSTDKILAMFADPKLYCLSARKKQRILEFVTRWKLDGKGDEISQKHIDGIL